MSQNCCLLTKCTFAFLNPLVQVVWIYHCFCNFWGLKLPKNCQIAPKLSWLCILEVGTCYIFCKIVTKNDCAKIQMWFWCTMECLSVVRYLLLVLNKEAICCWSYKDNGLKQQYISLVKICHKKGLIFGVFQPDKSFHLVRNIYLVKMGHIHTGA